MTDKDIVQVAINTIRTLSMDAVQQAKSGHPGTPMSMAPVMYCLWQRFLRYDPGDPIWPNRDRFVLSAGHASMLLYSMLHLTGVKAVNPKRRKAEWARAYGSAERVKWVKRQVCCICSAVPVDQAHIEGGGAGRKADADRIVPMCRPHHDMLHRMGRASFEVAVATRLENLPAHYASRFAQFQSPTLTDPRPHAR